MKTNDDIIRDFMQAWSTCDIDNIMSFFAEDAVYTNIPMEPANIGKPAIRQFIASFIDMCSDIHFSIHQQIADQHIVMNERTDHLIINGKKNDLRVMGVFELANGKITAWRDYFDMKIFS